MQKTHSTTVLPENYKVIRTIDLQHNKKELVIVNGLGFLMIAILMFIAFQFVTIEEMFPDEDPLFLLKDLLFLGMSILYLILHELTHGAAMKHFGGTEVKFGFTGLYAYAGTTKDYFDKYSYMIIALAPVIVWTILLTIPLVLVPKSWFVVCYLLQAINISGSCGDLYVSVIVSRYPDNIWIKDNGTAMSIYGPDATHQE